MTYIHEMYMFKKVKMVLRERERERERDLPIVWISEHGNDLKK